MTRSDKLSQVTIDTIIEAAHRRCQESPDAKGGVRRRLGRGRWETARALFRFETMNELWAWFCTQYPATAGKIASKEHPKEAPRALRDSLPWNMRDKGGDSCLCQC